MASAGFSTPLQLGCSSRGKLHQSLEKSVTTPRAVPASACRLRARPSQLSATTTLPSSFARAVRSRRRDRSLRAAVVARRVLRSTSATAAQVAYHPVRAAGAAYHHPAAAVASIVFDVLDTLLSSFPPGHAHAVIALACHLVMDLLLASPY
jgi:hypothetical protein